MKYVITGHTSGIGKGLYNRLSPDAKGFSLSTGYNINIRTDRERILNELENADVFINNASSLFGQIFMFADIFRLWKNDPSKTIINIGSVIADRNELPKNQEDLIEYQAAKIALKELSYRAGGSCKIIYKSFGFVGTEKILKKYPNFSTRDYISVDSAVDIIISPYDNKFPI